MGRDRSPKRSRSHKHSRSQKKAAHGTYCVWSTRLNKAITEEKTPRRGSLTFRLRKFYIEMDGTSDCFELRCTSNPEQTFLPFDLAEYDPVWDINWDISNSESSSSSDDESDPLSSTEIRQKALKKIYNHCTINEISYGKLKSDDHPNWLLGIAVVKSNNEFLLKLKKLVIRVAPRNLKKEQKEKKAIKAELDDLGTPPELSLSDDVQNDKPEDQDIAPIQYTGSDLSSSDE